MSEQDVLSAIHNFSELKNFANNAKIRSSLKYLLYEIKGILEAMNMFVPKSI